MARHGRYGLHSAFVLKGGIMAKKKPIPAELLAVLVGQKIVRVMGECQYPDSVYGPTIYLENGVELWFHSMFGGGSAMDVERPALKRSPTCQ